MKYIKKPIEIEAIELKNDDCSILSVLKFMNKLKEIDTDNKLANDSLNGYIDNIKENGLLIKTLEGEMKASIGDYIIKGVQGEFYPCRKDIFEKTYASV